MSANSTTKGCSNGEREDAAQRAIPYQTRSPGAYPGAYLSRIKAPLAGMFSPRCAHFESPLMGWLGAYPAEGVGRLSTGELLLETLAELRERVQQAAGETDHRRREYHALKIAAALRLLLLDERPLLVQASVPYRRIKIRSRSDPVARCRQPSVVRERSLGSGRVNVLRDARRCGTRNAGGWRSSVEPRS